MKHFNPFQPAHDCNFNLFKNPKLRMAAILKNKKSLYLSNGVTDHHILLHDGAH